MQRYSMGNIRAINFPQCKNDFLSEKPEKTTLKDYFWGIISYQPDTP